MSRTLVMGGTVHSPTNPFATAILIDDGRIAWVGDDTGAQVHRDVVDEVIDVHGAFVAPGFVDSHVHATSTGLQLTGLDLSHVRSADELLTAVHEHAALTRGGFVYGHGWDETTWRDDALPSRSALDRAAWGSEVYLSRVDVHSALVSSALTSQVPQAAVADGFSTDGPLSREAHSLIRAAAFARLSRTDRVRAQRATLEYALAHGIVAVHEMSGPSIGGLDDALALRDLEREFAGPHLTILWGEQASPDAFERLRQIGGYALGGDLFIDGSIGSHTAALIRPYSDHPSSSGTAYLTRDSIQEHLRECTSARIPAGFHVIGDAACADVSDAMRAVAQEFGRDAFRSIGHRLEHAEMLTGDDITSLAELGVTFSMQPIFDALWGGTAGMYDQRLGATRALEMNKIADIVAAGGLLAINSDSPVTPMHPWSIIRAATEHSNPRQRISARAAFTAHTRGGWRAVRDVESGVIAPGAPAHIAVWQVDELEVRVPDERIQGWSTDPRAATPGLPVLDGPDPQCLATIVAGSCRFGHDFWESARDQ